MRLNDDELEVIAQLVAREVRHAPTRALLRVNDRLVDLARDRGHRSLLERLAHIATEAESAQRDGLSSVGEGG
jgi:hypothetical protein